MQTLTAYFFTDFRFSTQAAWFKRLLYVFVVIESCYYLFHFGVFFGDHSIVLVNSQDLGPLNRLAFLLYDAESPALNLVFIVASGLLAVINLVTIRFRIVADILLWFLTVNIHYRIYPALTGGDNLLNQFLFFNSFLSSAYLAKNERQFAWRACLHNLGVIAIITQVCLVYLLSSVAKLTNDEWINGNAIIAVSRIHHFSLFSFLHNSPGLDPLLTLLNYIVLFYQLLFPVLIWIRPLKKALLFTGILMHLYIAFVMGLMSFGFIMILAYVFFWPPKLQES